jgi:hypothetical protein
MYTSMLIWNRHLYRNLALDNTSQTIMTLLILVDQLGMTEILLNC